MALARLLSPALRWCAGLARAARPLRRRLCPARWAPAAPAPLEVTIVVGTPTRGEHLAKQSTGGEFQKASQEAERSCRGEHRRRRRGGRAVAMRCKAWRSQVAVCLPACPEPEPNPEPSPRREQQQQQRGARNGAAAAAGDSWVAPTRPTAFRRATREARVRQLERQVGEFCALDFEEVDAAQQMGLTLRMLVILRTLTESVTYWHDDVQQQAIALRLLELDEGSDAAIERVIRRAGALVDRQAYRSAYEELCSARPWLAAPAAGREDEADELAPSPDGALPQKEPEGDGSTAVKDCECWMAEKRAAEVSVPPEQQKAAAAAALAAAPPPHGPLRGAGCLPILLGAHAACKALEVQPAHPAAPAAPTKALGAAEAPEGPASALRGCAPQQQGGGRRGSAASVAGAAPRGGGREVERKFLCRFRVGIEEEPAFQVCRRLIGPGGRHMKEIIGEAHGAKIRLRGQGSKYLEGPEKVESSEPLMVCISAPNRSSFERASSLVSKLLRATHGEYRDFCAARGWPQPDLLVRRESQRGR